MVIGSASKPNYVDRTLLGQSPNSPRLWRALRVLRSEIVI
jgi:hypothetical protein